MPKAEKTILIPMWTCFIQDPGYPVSLAFSLP